MVKKNLPAVLETWVQSLGREDLLKKKMATRFSILAWEIPWREELGRLQSWDCKKGRYELVTKNKTATITVGGDDFVIVYRELTHMNIGYGFFLVTFIFSIYELSFLLASVLTYLPEFCKHSKESESEEGIDLTLKSVL